MLADNGSTDGAPEQAASAGRATLVRTGGNLGYGAAANIGALGATGEWLVVANPDIVWSPGGLDALLEAADRWPDAGAYGPLIYTPQGDIYPSARAIPTIGRGIGHALVGWWWPQNPWTAAYRQERGAPAEGVTGWLSGSCLLLRRAAFQAVDGFDESYFMFCEDMDLCQRLAQAGWPSVYVPTATVTHAGGHSWRSRPARMLYHHHRSTYRFLARQYAGPAHAPLRLLLAGGLSLRFLASLAVRRIADGARPARVGSEPAPHLTREVG
jgi:N-acetylglucosaminyl-diphospho-decaprenol L-rhamnosyltransferase